MAPMLFISYVYFPANQTQGCVFGNATFPFEQKVDANAIKRLQSALAVQLRESRIDPNAPDTLTILSWSRLEN